MEQMDYEIDLIECLQILGKRKWLILTLVMVSALSAYIISANMTGIYSSSCKVMVIPPIHLQGQSLFRKPHQALLRLISRIMLSSSPLAHS